MLLIFKENFKSDYNNGIQFDYRNRTQSHSHQNRVSSDYSNRSHEKNYHYENLNHNNNDSGDRGGGGGGGGGESYRRSRDYDRNERERGGDRGREGGRDRERERGSSYYYDVHNSDQSNGYELNSNDDNRYSRYGNDMFFSDARSNRMVQNEALIREEMFRECTFRPRIKELPSAYGIGKDFNGKKKIFIYHFFF